MYIRWASLYNFRRPRLAIGREFATVVFCWGVEILKNRRTDRQILGVKYLRIGTSEAWAISPLHNTNGASIRINLPTIRGSICCYDSRRLYFRGVWGSRTPLAARNSGLAHRAYIAILPRRLPTLGHAIKIFHITRTYNHYPQFFMPRVFSRRTARNWT